MGFKIQESPVSQILGLRLEMLIFDVFRLSHSGTTKGGATERPDCVRLQGKSAASSQNHMPNFVHGGLSDVLGETVDWFQAKLMESYL